MHIATPPTDLDAPPVVVTLAFAGFMVPVAVDEELGIETVCVQINFEGEDEDEVVRDDSVVVVFVKVTEATEVTGDGEVVSRVAKVAGVAEVAEVVSRG